MEESNSNTEQNKRGLGLRTCTRLIPSRGSDQGKAPGGGGLELSLEREASFQAQGWAQAGGWTVLATPSDMGKLDQEGQQG